MLIINIIIIIIINNNNNNNNNNYKGIEVVQAGALAYHGNMDGSVHQSSGWHLWQVPTTQKPPNIETWTPKRKNEIERKKEEKVKQKIPS